MRTRRLAALAASVIVAVAGVAAGGCDGCEGGGLTDAAPPDSPAPGTLSLSWSVTDVNGQPVTCAQVGAQVVTLSVRNLGSVNGETAVFSCSSGMGTTQPFAPGTYVVDFELVDSNGQLSTLPRQTGFVVEPGRDTPIGALTFVVDAVGTLDLFLRATAAMSNCGPLNQMGAGWTGVTIVLSRPGGVCQPATIAIAPGATRPGGTYVVSCTAPGIAPCIESDQRLTAMNVPSDAYTIRVRGRVGAIDCWVNDDALQVPAQGRVLMGTLNLTKQVLPGC